MATSYGALCSDFYVNSKLGMKMDLPDSRETVLDLFDRVRKEQPQMRRFKRYRGELALESTEQEGRNQWLALRRTSVRAGAVNPESLSDAYTVHRLALGLVPFYLGVSALDVDYLEVLFGFDLDAQGNQNAIVHQAFFADSPMASIIDAANTPPIDVQPFIGVSLSERMDVQAYFEVKTRTTARQVRTGEFGEEPISVYLTVRKFGATDDSKDLVAIFDDLTHHAELLAETRVVPHLIQPLREAIASSRF